MEYSQKHQAKYWSIFEDLIDTQSGTLKVFDQQGNELNRDDIVRLILEREENA